MYCFKSKSLDCFFSHSGVENNPDDSTLGLSTETQTLITVYFSSQHWYSALLGPARPCSFLTSLLHLGCEDIDKHYRCHKWLYVSWGMTRWLVLHLLLSLPVPLYVCLMALHWCGSNFWSEETKEIWHPHSGHLLTQLPFSFLLSSEVLAFSRFLSLNHQISVKWHLRLLW